ncbi:MAG: glycosyltransferase family 2 protein, partial [Nitrospirae bacterium]|nr:glycosyltransferase family 2 protein [Nitrospirota bacterium]
MDIFLSFKDSHKYPLVTIVIPLYNEERFVADCLKSIKRQSYKNLECLIINDCSTDNSVQIAAKIIEGDKRFRIIHHAKNSGLSQARNTGIDNAQGKYICFLDSDDFLFSSSLWQRVYTIEQNDNQRVGGSYCGIIAVEEGRKLKSFHIERFLYHTDIIKTFISNRGIGPFVPLAPLFKTSVVREVKGFDVNMKHGGEDWRCYTTILRYGYKILPSYGIGGLYRQKNRSMMRVYRTEMLSEWIKIINESYEPLNRDNESIVYKNSICFYNKIGVMAERILECAMAALIEGQKEQVDEIIKQLDPSVSLLLEDHLNLNEIMDFHIRRLIGLNPISYRLNIKKYAPLKDILQQKVMSYLIKNEGAALK